jgi:nucleosome-remodeling factor subunit BPTF
LNPEIEEKLLELQRYQERQMKQEKTEVLPQPQVATSVTAKVPAKKRPSPTASQVVNQQQGVSVKDDWESTPKRKAPKLDTKDAK